MSNTASLSTLRARTTKALVGIELPACWASATIATEARLLAIPATRRTDGQRKALRRVSDKARALEVRT